MKARTITLAAVTVVAVAALAVLGTYRWASAHGPDVNSDGAVSVKDIYIVVSAFGSTVPTPTPVPPRETQLTLFSDRASGVGFGGASGSGNYTNVDVPIPHAVQLDPAFYQGAQFQLEVYVNANTGAAAPEWCFRIGTASMSITGTEACTSQDAPATRQLITSQPFVITAADTYYLYVANTLAGTGGMQVFSARLLGRWPEETP